MNEDEAVARVVMGIKFNRLIKVWEGAVEFESGKVVVVHGRTFRYVLDRITEEIEERIVDVQEV
jgi:hypothetical protein